jgi:hypothetical protein
MTKIKVFGREATHQEVENWFMTWKNGLFKWTFKNITGEEMYGYSENQIVKLLSYHRALGSALYNYMHPQPHT